MAVVSLVYYLDYPDILQHNNKSDQFGQALLVSQILSSYDLSIQFTCIRNSKAMTRQRLSSIFQVPQM